MQIWEGTWKEIPTSPDGRLTLRQPSNSHNHLTLAPNRPTERTFYCCDLRVLCWTYVVWQPLSMHRFQFCYYWYGDRAICIALLGSTKRPSPRLRFLLSLALHITTGLHVSTSNSSIINLSNTATYQVSCCPENAARIHTRNWRRLSLSQ